MNVYCIIVAGGKGLRMGYETPKQYIQLQGKPILMHTLEQLHNHLPQAQFILVIPQGDLSFWDDTCAKLECTIPHIAVEGGAERWNSVQHGLRAISSVKPNDLVAIHDAVRPFVSKNTVLNALKSAETNKSGVPVIPLRDSIRKQTEVGSEHLDRNAYRLVQTPQCFNLALLKSAFNAGFSPLFTDDASVFESAGHPIHLTEGNFENIKITQPEDLVIAEAFLSNLMDNENN
ncbi:MAG: 2-C-methyl-D-erythritol 4-phosphate cytidylyltransferase [Luteibaculaceae bacterium]